MTKRGKRVQFAPAKPVTPEGQVSCALPAWMYADPADVVERIELQVIAKAKRETAKRRAYEAGLSPITVSLMRRLRIKTLVRDAMNGEKQ